MAHIERHHRTRPGQPDLVTWRARYREPSGRERCKTFARKADAVRFLTTVEHAKLRGAYVDPSGGRVTLADYVRGYLDMQTFDPSTREQVELRFRVHILPALGSRELRELSPSIVQAWLRQLQGALAPRTVRVLLANLSGALSAAVDDELIARNPCRAGSVKAPKLEVRKIMPWPSAQVIAVLGALPDRYRACGTVAAGCGLRQGEVFGLRVCDIDFLRHRLRVEQQVKILASRPAIASPKGGKTRTVPLADGVALALAEHLRQFPAVGDALVFQSRERKPINRNYFNAHIWKPALRRAGIAPTRDNGMHALRHYFASVLIDAGESVRVVADHLGHTDPGFTLRVYAHLFPASEERTRRAVDEALAATSRGPVADQARR